MSVSGRMAIRPLLLLFSPLFIRGIRFCFLPLLLPYPDNPAYPYKFVFTSRFGFPVSSALSVFYRFRFCFCFCFCFFGFRFSVLGLYRLKINPTEYHNPEIFASGGSAVNSSISISQLSPPSSALMVQKPPAI